MTTGGGGREEDQNFALRIVIADDEKDIPSI
jgi:hypothetical protein